MIKNFHKVRANLYRGAAPSLSDVVALHRKFNIEKIISLDEGVGVHIAPVCKKLGIEHIIIPIYTKDINSLKHLLKLNITKLIDDSIPTFVHCLHGKDRTGLLIALCRCILDRWDFKKSLKEAKYLGFGTGLDFNIEKFYTKLIGRSCKNDHDKNEAYDIVSNMNDYNGEYRDYTLDKEEQISWAPYGDSRMRTYPEAFVDKDFDEQYQNRENYGLKGINDKEPDFEHIPMVGVYDQNTQVTNMVGPSLIGGGFV